MVGLRRRDDEMSGKCARAAKVIHAWGPRAATRNCPPFHFGVVPECARTSGVPEISCLKLPRPFTGRTRRASRQFYTACLNYVRFSLCASATVDPLSLSLSFSLHRLSFLIQLELSHPRAKEESLCPRHRLKTAYTLVTVGDISCGTAATVLLNSIDATQTLGRREYYQRVELRSDYASHR